MTDYEKEQLARCARNRVSGSKSRRCTLPSDNLTPAQRDKLNGEVQTWYLNSPMDFKTFQEMPVDLQQQYFSELVQQVFAPKQDVTVREPTEEPDQLRLTRFVLEGIYQELELKQALDLLIRPGSVVRITVERL